MQTAAQNPWYRQRWPWLLAIMPVTAVIAGFATLWLAIKSDDGLVADDYYKDGLAINKIIVRDEMARHYNLDAIAQIRDKAISLQLAGNLPVIPDSLQLTLNHPTRKGFDHVILLTRNKVGAYVGKAEDLIDARYDVILEPLNGAWRVAGQWRPAANKMLRLSPAALSPR
jgi:hypothetical protein